MARRQQHLPGIKPGVGHLEITIPTIPMWEQVGGDMSPGAYGAILAKSDGHSIELLEIQPVREHVGDSEAKEVGFPFWSKEAYFDLDDLDPKKDDVQSALQSIGMELSTLEEDYTPEQRAMVIAEALLGWGRGDEGTSGWSKDVVPDQVKWWGDKIAGPEYLADEDEEFIREILLGDLDMDYEHYGPDENEPESGLKVVTRGSTVEITEWTDIEAANGEGQPEGEKIVKTYAEVELDDLFNPNGKHRGTYGGDDKDVSIVELASMENDEDREKAIVSAAISYLGYHGGEEEYVDAIGD